MLCTDAQRSLSGFLPAMCLSTGVFSWLSLFKICYLWQKKSCMNSVTWDSRATELYHPLSSCLNINKYPQGKTDFSQFRSHVHVETNDHWQCVCVCVCIILIIKPRPHTHPVARFNCQKQREKCRCEIFPSWIQLLDKVLQKNIQEAGGLSAQEDSFVSSLWLSLYAFNLLSCRKSSSSI